MTASISINFGVSMKFHGLLKWNGRSASHVRRTRTHRHRHAWRMRVLTPHCSLKWPQQGNMDFEQFYGHSMAGRASGSFTDGGALSFTSTNRTINAIIFYQRDFKGSQNCHKIYFMWALQFAFVSNSRHSRCEKFMSKIAHTHTKWWLCILSHTPIALWLWSPTMRSIIRFGRKNYLPRSLLFIKLYCSVAKCSRIVLPSIVVAWSFAHQ